MNEERKKIIISPSVGRSNAVALGLGRPDPTWGVNCRIKLKIVLLKNLHGHNSYNFLFCCSLKLKWKKDLLIEKICLKRRDLSLIGYCLLYLKLVSFSARWCLLRVGELGMWTARLPINGPWIVLWYNFFTCFWPLADTWRNYFKVTIYEYDPLILNIYPPFLFPRVLRKICTYRNENIFMATTEHFCLPIFFEQSQHS